MRTLTVTLLAALMFICTPAHAGYRNILLELKSFPPDGYHPGDTGKLCVTTTYGGAPLPHQLVYVGLERVAPNGGTYTTEWAFRTNQYGKLTVPLEFGEYDLPGWWYVNAFTFDLPDGTADNDAITFQVTPE